MKTTTVIARFLLGLIFLTLIHILMLPSGLGLALVVTVLWIVLFLSVRSAFFGLLQPRVTVQGLSPHRFDGAPDLRESVLASGFLLCVIGEALRKADSR
jgi:hypothetical protein